MAAQRGPAKHLFNDGPLVPKQRSGNSGSFKPKAPPQITRKAKAPPHDHARLDQLDFLKISGHQLLDHPGTLTASEARAKAEHEYRLYRHQLGTQPHPVDTAFEQAATQLKKLPR